MNWTRGIIGTAVTLALGCGGLGYWVHEQNGTIKEANARAEQLQQRLDATGKELTAAHDERQTLEAEAEEVKRAVEAERRRVEALEREKEQAVASQRTLETEMRKALASKDVTISELQGKLTVNILDRILFDSGKAVVKPEGREVLSKIAEVLATVPDRQILVAGHTDNVPTSASRHLYATNWELSTARATAAVRHLVEQAGVDPQRVGAIGYGEFHPVADNDSDEGRARNRRIEIIILAQDVLGSRAE
ncbi:MAG: Outer membrane porin F precursor [Lentisphaerae bacterium ADurb.BinA184]|nr:MAG: Outer membrane porin F precursor [Lentisphaerae bacterium ADurb.BinA184]